MKNSLKDWKWCIDYSNSTGQIDAVIPPVFFSSREKAQKHNKSFPKGRVVKVSIKIVKI